MIPMFIYIYFLSQSSLFIIGFEKQRSPAFDFLGENILQMPQESSEGCLKSSAVFKDGSSREMISKELRGEKLKLAHLLICVFLSSDLKEGKVSLFCRDRRTEIANKINQL